MMSSTKALPDGYNQTGEIDLSKNKRLSILLSLAAILLFVPSCVGLVLFAGWARPELTGPRTFSLGIVAIVGLFVSVVFMLLIHELIHGLFFWMFTRSKPVFALRPLYAYAAAPDWFIPARQYWIVGLAPLVLIDVLGLLLIFVASPGWVMVLAFVVALNTAGSVGDLYIVARLFRLSSGSLVKDTGDRISFYEPVAAVSTSV
jgi:hypothetical protein